MKKKIWVFIIATMLALTTLSTSFAAEYTGNASEEDIMSFDTLQGLFPNIPLREDGFVDGYNQGIALATAQELEEIFSEPIESYSADYNGGTCTLDIYSNGQYGVYGFEKVEEISPMSVPGYEGMGGTKYKTYYNMFPLHGFSYTYNVTGSTYSTISNLSSVSVYGGISFGYFEAGSSRYVRKTQTTTAAAEVYGEATYYHNGYLSGDIRITTTVSGGNIRVYFGS